jgi:large subunit ribosomal protein L29
MKPEETRALSIEEMKATQKEIVQELFNLKVQNATGQLENPLRLRLLRRDLARVKTILAEKEREAQSNG